MLPGNAELMVFMGSVLHDDTIFEEPLKFDPERYMGEDASVLKQKTIPFSVGKCDNTVANFCKCC